MKILGSWMNPNSKDSREYVFFCERDKNVFTVSSLQKWFKQQKPQFTYNGFYLGIDPNKYFLVFGIKSMNKKRTNLFNHLAQELKQKFKDHEKDVLEYIDEKIKKEKDIINNKKLTDIVDLT